MPTVATKENKKQCKRRAESEIRNFKRSRLQINSPLATNSTRNFSSNECFIQPSSVISSIKTVAAKSTAQQPNECDLSSWNVGAMRKTLDQANEKMKFDCDHRIHCSDNTTKLNNTEVDDVLPHFSNSHCFQVQRVCERLLKEQVIRLRFEYEQELIRRFEEQRKQFIQFIKEQNMNNVDEGRWGYLS
ncbi:unnamed protein product [Dracunculus medinensis]|uniref:Akirin n=1 Tax=Dracunculus medinensis TaxID=318479 RepID=A0A0N4UMS1_DRAME|nr:unnamed protein product [Dracunculus medinensis]